MPLQKCNLYLDPSVVQALKDRYGKNRFAGRVRRVLRLSLHQDLVPFSVVQEEIGRIADHYSTTKFPPSSESVAALNAALARDLCSELLRAIKKNMGKPDDEVDEDERD